MGIWLLAVAAWEAAIDVSSNATIASTCWAPNILACAAAASGSRFLQISRMFCPSFQPSCPSRAFRAGHDDGT
jgi:hypothetical protein